MQTISATYRATTPMFLGGANPRGAPELRVPSIKGLLRFWWRAIRWPDFLGQCRNDKSRALNELRKYEDALFGSIRTGQSSFLMSAVWADIGGDSIKVQSTWPPNEALGSGYLGYGITESKRQALTHRTGWSESCSFTVKCAFPQRAGETSLMVDARMNEIRLAIRSLGMFGGLGARSRRGFGSVALSKVDQEPVNVETRNSLIQQINSLIPKTANGTELPPLTAFSRHAQIRLFDPDPKNFPAKEGSSSTWRVLSVISRSTWQTSWSKQAANGPAANGCRYGATESESTRHAHPSGQYRAFGNRDVPPVGVSSRHSRREQPKVL